MEFKLMYPGFRLKALTLSYDDGAVQDRDLVPLLNKYGLKATFNLNSGLQGVLKTRKDIDGHDVDCRRLDLKECASLYDGHEIASHTASHPFLETLGLRKQSEEFRSDISSLQAIFGRKIIGCAYPYGTYDLNTFKALRANRLIYARTTRSTHDFRRPFDFLLWHPTAHHNEPGLFGLLDAFFASDEELAVFYIWGHSYEFALQHNLWIIDELGKRLKGHSGIYLATNAEICLYVKAAELVYYKKREEGYLVNPSDLTVFLLDGEGRKVALAPKERIRYE